MVTDRNLIQKVLDMFNGEFKSKVVDPGVSIILSDGCEPYSIEVSLIASDDIFSIHEELWYVDARCDVNLREFLFDMIRDFNKTYCARFPNKKEEENMDPEKNIEQLIFERFIKGDESLETSRTVNKVGTFQYRLSVKNPDTDTYVFETYTIKDIDDLDYAIKDIFTRYDHNVKCHQENAKDSNPENDNVNHPSHYTSGGIECIDAIEASMTPSEFMGYCKGNIIKYVWRYPEKNGVEDLEKAEWYLKHLINKIKKEGDSKT